MREKPKRGRPSKAPDFDARKALIQSTLAAARAEPELDIQRQVLAGNADVTPALISYYFPDKWLLIYLAVSPVVLAYGRELEEIAKRQNPDVDTIRSLIKIYVRFNIDDGMLLDFYLTSLRKIRRDEEFQHFKNIYASVLRLIDGVMDAGFIRKTNPVMVQSSLWGLSLYIARNFRIIPNLLSADYSPDVDGLAELVFDMIIGGAAGRGTLNVGDIAAAAVDVR